MKTISDSSALKKKSISRLVSCHGLQDPDIISGLAFALPDFGQTLPADIQIFPPGDHQINATKGGKPATLDVSVNAAAAAALKKDFGEIMAAAVAGTGPRPFIDFNHEDRDASGWVTDIYWAGEDPKVGGIRAKVDWTKPGGEAVLGKSYRQFSPNFRVHPVSGEIIGTTANMGGLVNRPAFKTIQPFFAKDGDGRTEPQKKMKKLTQALVAAGLLSAGMEEDEACSIDFRHKFEAVQAKLGAVDASERLVKTQAETIKAVETERDTYKVKVTKMAEVHADSIIAKWVGLGVIAAKDEPGKAAWRAMLITNPDNEKLMDGVVSAKQAQGGAGDPTVRIIQNGSAQGAGTAGAGESTFVVKAKQIATERKLSEIDAQIVTAREFPQLYNDYRNGLTYADGARA